LDVDSSRLTPLATIVHNHPSGLMHDLTRQTKDSATPESGKAGNAHDDN
jgi:hypothetical protein